MKTWARKTFTDTRTDATGADAPMHHTNDVFLVPMSTAGSGRTHWEFAMAEDTAAAAQVLEAMLLTEAGEVPTDVTRGVDNLGTVLQNAALSPRWAENVRRTAADCPYVASVKALDYSVGKDGRMDYTLRVGTVYGTEEEISRNG